MTSVREPRRGALAPTWAGRGARRFLTAAFVVLGVVILRAFVVAPVQVSGPSMSPTLDDGQVVLLAQWDRDRVPRGALVVLADPQDRTRIVKRVVATAGDRVVIRDAQLFVNGSAVEEPYVDRSTIDGLYTPTVRVPAGHVFVLGDNRGSSIDSRTYGPLPLDAVEGRVVMGLWPPAPM